MDFSFTDEQVAVRDLAARIFQRAAPVERVKAVEATGERVDRDLWATLAEAGLLGIALPVDHGGSGLGPIELCLLLEQQGRAVAPVPLWPTLTAAAAVAEWGSDEQRARWLPAVIAGDAMLTVALTGRGSGDPGRPSVRGEAAGGGWVLHGHTVDVPAAHVAAAVVVSAQLPGGATGTFLLDATAAGVTRVDGVATNREIRSELALDGAAAEPLGPPEPVVLDWLVPRALVGLCALAVGVACSAVARAAEHTSQRHQFGRPLSTFQGTALRAADAFIDTEAMRVTLWQAAWRLATGRPAAAEVLVAKWWAAEAGQRVVHATQHMHGGLGADVDHPIHRYFLWGKQIENTLGGASATLARLGDVLAVSPPHAGSPS